MHNILGIVFWDTHREKEKNMETITFSIWVVSSCYWAYAPLLRTSGMHKTGSPVVWLYGSLSWERDYMFESLLAWVEGLFFLLYTRQRCYKWTHYGKYRSGRDLHTLELRRLYTNETASENGCWIAILVSIMSFFGGFKKLNLGLFHHYL